MSRAPITDAEAREQAEDAGFTVYPVRLYRGRSVLWYAEAGNRLLGPLRSEMEAWRAAAGAVRPTRGASFPAHHPGNDL